MRRTLISTIAALGFAAGPVNAEETVGIAFVQAPEQSSAVCFADNLDKAFACAKKECAKRGGATARDCLRTTWCYPSRWSANLFLQHKGYIEAAKAFYDAEVVIPQSIYVNMMIAIAEGFL